MSGQLKQLVRQHDVLKLVLLKILLLQLICVLEGLADYVLVLHDFALVFIAGRQIIVISSVGPAKAMHLFLNLLTNFSKIIIMINQLTYDISIINSDLQNIFAAN